MISKGKLANIAKTASFRIVSHQAVSGSDHMEEWLSSVDLGLSKDAKRPSVRIMIKGYFILLPTYYQFLLLGALSSPDRSLLLAGVLGANDIPVNILKPIKSGDQPSQKVASVFLQFSSAYLFDYRH